jgi:small GTP-binding protein
MESSPKRRIMERILKIIVVGDMGTGKAALIKKFVEDNSPWCRSAMDVDFSRKIVRWSGNTRVNLQFWEIAGQERFGNMTGIYYRGCVGAIVVFDLTRGNTFKGTAYWTKDIDDKVRILGGKVVPKILLGNNIDLLTKDNWEQRRIEIEKYRTENGYLGFFETSEKDGRNLEAAITSLIDYIMTNNIQGESLGKLNEGVNIDGKRKYRRCL